jgi:hypothetical protein
VVTYALDYSAGRPSAAQVLAAGYVGVIRYVGFPSNRKCITADEYRDMTSNGVGVSLVYEQSVGDALRGRAAGQAAARLALAHAADVGYPVNTRPIYYACDTDVVSEAEFAAVLDYLRGAGDIHGGPSRVGVYGEYDVVERAAHAGVAAWRWQTRAWSGGRLSTQAQIRQEIGTYTVGGIGCDRNTILVPDWGQTGLVQEEIDMPLTPADVDLIWNESVAWPPNTDLPHGKDVYNLREWIVGANIGAARALVIVTTLTAQVAALAALMQHSGGLTAEQTHQIALDAAQEAVAGLSFTVNAETT